ncbi:MAG TPA: hypothetical protein VGH33_15995, partial [Isosphaeraceae bacterium]
DRRCVPTPTWLSCPDGPDRVAEDPVMAESYPPDDQPGEPRRSPWWPVARGVGIASDPRSIVLAALGLVALRSGWMGLGLAMGWAPWLDSMPGKSVPGLDLPDEAGPLLASVARSVTGLFAPFVALFRPDVPAWDRIEAALACVWLLFVWGLFGTAIARVAVVRVATGERVGVIPALRFGLARIGRTVAAPLGPILVAMSIGLAGAAVGLLDRLPGSFGRSAATVLAFVPLIVGLLDAVILLGLALAWPLMIATVAAEGEDFFDAISRSYSYVNQRTARYAVLLLLAAVIGVIGLAMVGLFVVSALTLADWSTSLGAPRHEGFRFLDPSSADRAGLPMVAHFWTEAVEFLAAGWIYSYVWSASAIVYLLLRHDVDGAELHEVYVPGGEESHRPPD